MGENSHTGAALCRFESVDDGADALAAGDAADAVFRLEAEDEDRDAVIHAQGERGIIHHRQAAVDDLDIADLRDGLRVGIHLGVRGVDIVGVLGQQQGFRADFRRTQRRGGIVVK